jgi:hypothetical protein
LIVDTDIRIKRTVLPKNSEEEKEFLGSAALSIQLLDTGRLDSVARIEEVSQVISVSLLSLQFPSSSDFGQYSTTIALCLGMVHLLGCPGMTTVKKMKTMR